MAIGRYGALLDAVRGVRWPARRAVPGGAPGAHQARSRGIAPEFAEYRPYRQGDDPRRVDWKLLARSDRAYIRLAPDRAVLGTTMVVDASASMAYPAEGPNKWSLAREVAVALAAVAHASADPVGLVVMHAGGMTALRPRARRGVLAEMALTLDGISPAGALPLHPALAHVRGRLVIITDCLGDLAAMRRAARALAAQGGEVTVVHIVARLEVDPPAGALLAIDPEVPAVERSLTDSGRASYSERFAAWRAQVARGWRDDGVSYVEARDDEPAERVVRRVVAAAQRVAGA
jgi:uncharacterized protein (DUF58 family)